MKFSRVVDYKGDSRHAAGNYFLVRRGTKNARILAPHEEYEKSFVVPIKKLSNIRPADVVQDDDNEVDFEAAQEAAEQEEADLLEEYQPQ